MDQLEAHTMLSSTSNLCFRPKPNSANPGNLHLRTGGVIDPSQFLQVRGFLSIIPASLVW
jgi:hypothetical protein